MLWIHILKKPQKNFKTLVLKKIFTCRKLHIIAKEDSL